MKYPHVLIKNANGDIAKGVFKNGGKSILWDYNGDKQVFHCIDYSKEEILFEGSKKELDYLEVHKNLITWDK